jgi:hypothetical protein
MSIAEADEIQSEQGFLRSAWDLDLLSDSLYCELTPKEVSNAMHAVCHPNLNRPHPVTGGKLRDTKWRRSSQTDHVHVDLRSLFKEKEPPSWLIHASENYFLDGVHFGPRTLTRFATDEQLEDFVDGMLYWQRIPNGLVDRYVDSIDFRRVTADDTAHRQRAPDVSDEADTCADIKMDEQTKNDLRANPKGWSAHFKTQLRIQARLQGLIDSISGATCQIDRSDASEVQDLDAEGAATWGGESFSVNNSATVGSISGHGMP